MILALAMAFMIGCLEPAGSNRQPVAEADCVVCHTSEYDATTAPVHAGAFPTVCSFCHVETSWVPAVYTHPWPLTGAHTTTECVACHTGTPPRWAGTPTNCVDCHRADYDASPFPGHSAFPTTCDSCHTTMAWTPALEGAHPENAFPIRNGPHTYACMDCHDASRGASLDGMNTDCIGCHTGQHTLSRANSQHREVGNYVPDASRPNFCLDCHPNGRN